MIDSALIQRWQHVQSNMGDAQLIAVSKYTSDSNIEILLAEGHLDFGEAKPQNLRDRAQKYPLARWHMIGPLQKNKAKYIGRFAYMWHSCCNIETAKEVAKHVEGRRLPVFVQVNISDEPQKQGIQPDDIPLFLQQLALIEGLEVIGLMGMAAKDGDAKLAFSLLRQCRDDVIAQYPHVQGLCMGMSNDWRIAIEEGATMIRVGSEIFGQD
ncbi:YggS family pyridoxal phosphate-dependent enzyme [Ghiorsea bivora]|uniref:YggS family pyridoxal phosphate-dependent enzyme n=1 Tax=Ghiorsea bivora TaxID=1485545 RepID=UPI0005711B47|nr:YggS family pyridoxal phosphate-dependent enzyme [Ghiorsea bivora]